jgi:DNA topoisomerase-1
MARKKKGKYTVIITEKPDATKKIAKSIAGKKAKKMEKREAFWYEFKKDKRNVIVVPAVGHIFALDTIKDGSGWTYPTFNVHWIPSFQKKGSEFSEKYFRNIEDVIKNIEDENVEFVIATDYDTEGSVIGYNVLRFICNVNDAKRMKFSTLTKDELAESYKKRNKHLDFSQVESGLTRHYLDFFWGINLTRALTLAMKNAADRGFAILSTGRVQGPTLAILLEKELKIRKFKSKPYWQLKLKVKADSTELVAWYEKNKVWDKKEAKKIVKNCKGKDAVVKNIKKRKYRQKPPVPFNTTDLQSEAYSQFKYSPRRTLGIAESLYQAGYISYPRSSSQKLPPSINYKRILEAIAKLRKYSKLAKELLQKPKLEPKEGKRADPAHPAVYPTFEPPKLSKLNASQKKLYDLIVRRFMSVFADKALRESNTVTLDVNKNKFTIVGKRTIEPGWTKFYKKYLAFEEQILPELEVGQKLKVSKVEMLDKETQPPGRYSQGSILKIMENKGLGTRATRAEILQTLYSRNYIIGKSIQVTKLGEVVTKVLKEFSPRILSEKMTRKFERNMDDVYNNEKKREDVVKEAKKLLEETLKEFHKNEKKIGKKLLKGLVEARKERRTLGKCPNCKDGELRIIVSRRTGKRFVGCSSYPKCHTGFPLPQNGFITPLGTLCKECNLPMIQVKRKGKRPYRMCINHKCKTKENWGKKKGKSKKGKKSKKKKIKKK